MMQIALFLVLYVFGETNALVDCEGLPSLDTLGTQLDEVITTNISSAGVLSYGTPNYTCQVQGTTKGTYREVSVIVEYVDVSGTSEVVQFEMSCLNFDGNWDARLDSFTIPTSSTGVSERTDCSSCQATAGNDNHCIACSSSCNVGLMKCTGAGESDCCVAFEDNMCKSDLNCDKQNFIANEQNEFICSCNSSCNDSYLLITNSTGCFCVMSTIADSSASAVVMNIFLLLPVFILTLMIVQFTN